MRSTRTEDLPFISFIIPTYNEEKNIKSCIESILLQDYPPERMEILVIDGLSRDKTVEIAKKYPAKIVVNEKRIIPEACNLGIKNAKGEILAFLGADSELPQRDWLHLMIAPLLNDVSVAGSIPILIPNTEISSYQPIFLPNAS